MRRREHDLVAKDGEKERQSGSPEDFATTARDLLAACKVDAPVAVAWCWSDGACRKHDRLLRFFLNSAFGCTMLTFVLDTGHLAVDLRLVETRGEVVVVWEGERVRSIGHRHVGGSGGASIVSTACLDVEDDTAHLHVLHAAFVIARLLRRTSGRRTQSALVKTLGQRKELGAFATTTTSVARHRSPKSEM